MNGTAHIGRKSPPSDAPLTISEQFRRHSTMSHKIVIYINYLCRRVRLNDALQAKNESSTMTTSIGRAGTVQSHYPRISFGIHL